MSLRNLSGLTALVTGATSGIGYETALGLAKMHARVIVHGRSASSAQSAAVAIRAAQADAEVETVHGDLADLDAVRDLAVDISSLAPALDMLVHNAGCITKARVATPQGHETQLAVNHLAPFLLTQRLFDNLLAARGVARVVHVASRAHYRGHTDLDDLNWTRRDYSGWGAYADSKLAMVASSIAWSKRIGMDRICFHAVHPGVVGSNFGRGWGWLELGMKLVRPFLLSNEAGARTSLYCAVSPDLEGRSGGYYSNCNPQTPLARACDPAFQNALWEKTAALCGLGG